MSLLNSIFIAALLTQNGTDAGRVATTARNSVVPGAAAVEAVDHDGADAGASPGFAFVPERVVPLLQIWAADGGTAFSGGVTGEPQTVELRPGEYSLQLGKGPTTAFKLAEDNRLPVQGTNVTLLGVWPAGEEIPFLDAVPTLRTVKRKGWGELTLGFGATHPRRIPGFAAALSLLYGVTDRLQINPLPYFSYVLGDIGESEWILEGGVPLLGFDSDGSFLLLSASVGRRSYWRPDRSWIAGIEGTSYVGWGESQYEPPLRSFGYITGRAQAGVAMTFARRVTVNLGAAANTSYFERGTRLLSFPWREPFPGYPSVSVGSVLRLAGRDLPLVQVHLTRRLSLDVWSTAAVGRTVTEVLGVVPTTEFPLYVDVLGGVTWVGGWN